MAEKEFNKKINYIGEIKLKYNRFKTILFSDLLKHDDIILDINKLDNIENKFGKDIF